MAGDSSSPLVLLVDDESSVLDTLAVLLRTRLHVRTRTAGSAEEALELLERTQPAVVLSDVHMQGSEGAGLLVLERSRQLWPDVPVILMSAVASREAAIRALNARAFHFLEKPFGNDEVVRVVQSALTSQSARSAARSGALAARPLSRRHNHAGERRSDAAVTSRLVGESEAWTEARALVEVAAARDLTVLLEGESGVGKGLLAAHLHATSRRASRPFLSVNCGALTDSLLESQLFGHVRGAFTGADRDTPGMVRAADGGTLFLDEIGEMSLSAQVRLLHVLQERCVTPVGGTTPVGVDVRFVAATNRDLPRDVAAGRFREDLYYRLNVIAVWVPALRDRSDDLPALVANVLEALRLRDPELPARGLTEDALELLARYPWPGNVRELENAVTRMAVVGREVLTAEDVPPYIRQAVGLDSGPIGLGRGPVTPPRPGMVGAPGGLGLGLSGAGLPGAGLPGAGLPESGAGPGRLLRQADGTLPTLATIEQAYVAWVLAQHQGDVGAAARALGVPAGVLLALTGGAAGAAPGPGGTGTTPEGKT